MMLTKTVSFSEKGQDDDLKSPSSPTSNAMSIIRESKYSPKSSGSNISKARVDPSNISKSSTIDTQQFTSLDVSTSTLTERNLFGTSFGVSLSYGESWDGEKFSHTDNSDTSSPSATKTNDIPEVIDECLYDEAATGLYKTIEDKQWEETRRILRMEESLPLKGGMRSPQSATWIIRKEADGTTRWRLLPIHAAILFRAPLDVIKSIIRAYPDGAKCKDDQGMLPIHLAFRNDGEDDVMEELLRAYPPAIYIEDSKGRTPIECVKQPQDRAPQDDGVVGFISFMSSPTQSKVEQVSNSWKRAKLMSTYAAIIMASERGRLVRMANAAYAERINDIQSKALKDYQLKLRAKTDEVCELRYTLKEIENKNCTLEEFEKLTVLNVKAKKCIKTLQAQLKEENTVRLKEQEKHDELMVEKQNLDQRLHDYEKLVEELKDKNLKMGALQEAIVKFETANPEFKVSDKDEDKDNVISQFKVESYVNETRAERDALSQEVAILKSKIRSLVEEQAKIFETVLKCEQTATNATLVRETTLTTLLDQERDVENVLKIERKKMWKALFDQEKELETLGNSNDDQQQNDSAQSTSSLSENSAPGSVSSLLKELKLKEKTPKKSPGNIIRRVPPRPSIL
eukprot:CAMPEP_0184864248 /NCGR_PEP_ID=MMETSP0580-20130426/14250_1 /TAXON_ID=1118495 /ORGANISM="Dactyliosolen fragilissimus" /LENGTH=626 /DNA_ID=CAMNT_0027362953 /DNA_START=142 /DNA_END=2022 /DNA_ORIENTATION=+